jgi:predicted chitinase
MTQSDFEAIANGAFGGREELGNSGHFSGGGWKCRGRGLKQLTGLDNYKSFQCWYSKHSAQWPNDYAGFIASPDLLLDMKYAVRSVVSFWMNNRLYKIADNGSCSEVVDLITDIVNKYTKSHSDRRAGFSDLWIKGSLN